MCGFAGFIDNQECLNTNHSHLEVMLNSLLHRGPDDSGIWKEAGVCIGHRRLSIQDLSFNGHQPMKSTSGRFILVFNGEIYNYKSLRTNLKKKGISFQGCSDTEVLLALIETEGIENAIHKCVGMFAIALWDISDKRLYLARDRFGEKPLYYGWHDGVFIFGSELKALMAHPKFKKVIDKKSLSLLLSFGYIQSPHSIFKNTYKLQQGCIHTFKFPASIRSYTKENCESKVIDYWSSDRILTSNFKKPFNGNFDEATDELEELLIDSVSLQMHADVPLGAFLSGGVDSSLIVSLMQRLTNRQVQTFTIGFDDPRFNEAEYSKSIANHLETDHTELYLNNSDVQNIICKLPSVFDEPFADQSQIPTYLLSRLAKHNVTVCLSGDGADEIFCGYNKYFLGSKISNIRLRKFWAHSMKILPWKLIEDIGSILPVNLSKKISSERIEFIYKLLSANDNIELAKILSKSHLHPELFTKENVMHDTVFDNSSYADISQDFEYYAMALDRKSYLPDNIMTKVDRASMAVSLECRAPFLDYRIYNFASSLPHSFLSDGSTGKKILRELLFRYIPPNLIDRPKMGFSIPLADWLRGDLYNWAMDLLHGSDDEYLNLTECKNVMQRHFLCERDYSPVLWPILMFQAWRQEWL